MCLCLCILLGGFISVNKSVLEPTRDMEFLGFRLNTCDQTIRVPLDKYEKCVQLINDFITDRGPTINIKTLERIRRV